MSAGGRTLTRGRWRSGWPCVDIAPNDIAWLRVALDRIAGEFGIASPAIEEADPEDLKGGWSCDFVIDGVPAGAYLNGRRCSIGVNDEAIRDRICELLMRLDA